MLVTSNNNLQYPNIMETQQSSDESEEKNSEKLGLFKTFIEILCYPDHSFHYLIFVSFCMSVQYYCLTFLIPLYFTWEFGFSDVESGLIFGLFGAIVGVFSIVFSYFVYGVSLKKGLLASAGLGVAGFLLLIIGEKYSSLVGIFLEAVSCALFWPYLEYGIKEYSLNSHRNLCSSLYFISVYAAGIMTGLTIDCLNQFGTKQVFTIVYIICIVFLLIAARFLLKCTELSISSYEKVPITEIICKKKFFKFFWLNFFLIVLRSSTFGHLDATFPKYFQRINGQKGKFGTFIAIHSTIMIISAFFCTKLTDFFSNPGLILIGNMVAVSGSLPLAFSNDNLSFFIFIFCMALGEALITPRLLDYTYYVACENQERACENQERVYLAMSSLPFYFSMILTGISSGELLENFCPDQRKTCNNVWKINFLTSFSSFIVFVFAKKWLFDTQKPSDEIELIKIGNTSGP